MQQETSEERYQTGSSTSVQGKTQDEISTKGQGGKSSKRGKRGRDGSKGTNSYHNDPKWYLKSPRLAQLTGDINYTYPAGGDIPVVVGHTPSSATPLTYPQNMDFTNWKTPVTWHRTLPSLLTLRVYPSVGIANSRSSALNVAANGLRTFQRSTNTGRINYDAPDLFLYLLGNADIYAYIVWLERLASVFDGVNKLNWTIPELFYRANYCDPDDIMPNIRKLWTGIETLIIKASRLVVPDQNAFPIFSRRAFMFEGVYTEGNSVKDQLYMFTPAAFYKWSFDDKGKGQLVLAGEDLFKPGSSLTVDQLITFGLELIDAMFLDSTHSTMSGDLLKAYGNNIIKLGTFNPNLRLEPTFNIEVLEQIKNATAVGQIYGGSINQEVGEVTKGDPYLTSVYYAREGLFDNLTVDNEDQYWLNYALTGTRLLTTSTNDVSSVLTVLNTRLVNTLDPDLQFKPNPFESSQRFPMAINCGTEICEAFYTWTLDEGFEAKWDRHIQMHMTDFAPNTAAEQLADNLSTLWRQTASLGNFKFHPIVTEVVYDYSSPHKYRVIGDTFDYDNFAMIDPNELKQIHETCLLSLFGVPDTSIGYSSSGRQA
nr:putative capsid [Marmot picobirnavirus]